MVSTMPATKASQLKPSTTLGAATNMATVRMTLTTSHQAPHQRLHCKNSPNRDLRICVAPLLCLVGTQGLEIAILVVIFCMRGDCFHCV